MKPIAAPFAAALSALAASLLAPLAHAQDFPSPNEGAAYPTPSLSTANPNAANPNAARAVHLQWETAPATTFANTITVDESVPGSFFVACGFGSGYFGLQEQPDKSRVAIFSVWDELGSDNPNAGNPPQRVEVLGNGDGVRVSRFGAQGTGARTTWPFAWKTGRSYTLMVRALPDADRVIYSGYIAGPGIEGWKLMGSLRTRAAAPYMQGLYSFVEDFRRDGKSLQQARRARFNGGLVQTPGLDWVSITRGQFGADSNPQSNINAAIESRGEEPMRQQFFTLATGGLTRQSTGLGTRLETAPIKLPN